jgi:hypothetical protein
VQEYLGSFGAYDWLWRDDKDAFYQARSMNEMDLK